MSKFTDAVRMATGLAASILPLAIKRDLYSNVSGGSIPGYGPYGQSFGAPGWYAAGEPGRLTASWGMSSRPQYAMIRRGLRALRARSREQTMNNPYVRRFMKLLRSNVIGPHGMRLIARSEFIESGTKDEAANKAIQDSWKEWGRKENIPEASGLSWHEAENVFIETVARDGEVLIRHLEGTKNNKWRYTFQFIDPELLDVWLNKDNGDGSGIVMGVEVDKYRRPVAYHFLEDRIKISEWYEYGSGSRHNRVPAEEIEHIWLPEWIWQTRGVPWTSTALMRLNMLGGYEEAELVAARVAAAKMGFFTRNENWAGDDDDYRGDGTTDATGDIIEEAEPGSFTELPVGYDFKLWDPQHPNNGAGLFMKTMLRGIASGLDVGYNTLANDMEGPNFGSLRVGMIAERDVWQALQIWVHQRFHDVLYRRWLKMALLAGAIPVGKGSGVLRLDKLDKYTKVSWQARAFDWIDPQKEATAKMIELNNLLTSRSEIIRSKGKDPEEVFREIAAENELFEELGLAVVTEPVKQGAQQAEETDPEEQGNDPATGEDNEEQPNGGQAASKPAKKAAAK